MNPDNCQLSKFEISGSESFTRWLVVCGRGRPQTTTDSLGQPRTALGGARGARAQGLEGARLGGQNGQGSTNVQGCCHTPYPLTPLAPGT